MELRRHRGILETNHVSLLMGVEHTVTSTVPLSVSAPGNAVAIMAGINDGRTFNVKWPLAFDLSPDGNGVGFTGCGNCECGGCSIDGTYALEGSAFTMPSLWCGCTAVGSGFQGVPQFPASVSVDFDKLVVFYEDAYTNAPNDIVAHRSRVKP